MDKAANLLEQFGGESGGEGGVDPVAALTAQLNLLSGGEEEIPVSEAEVDDVVKGIMSDLHEEDAKKLKKQKEREAEAASKKILAASVRLVQEAVSNDNAGNIMEAATKYDEAVTLLGTALEYNGEEKANELVTKMVGYMDRINALVGLHPSCDPNNAQFNLLNRSRRATYARIGATGYSLLTRGLGLRKQGHAIADSPEGKVDPVSQWQAFLLLGDALDALVAYMKIDRKNAQNEALNKGIMKTMATAESLKASLVASASK